MQRCVSGSFRALPAGSRRAEVRPGISRLEVCGATPADDSAGLMPARSGLVRPSSFVLRHSQWGERDSMDSSIPYYILLALCFGASFLLSGMESGVFGLNRLRIRRLARGGQASAQILNRFLEKPERFLWTILVGNTLANFIILGWILARLHELFLGVDYQRAWEVSLFAVIVFLFYALFDLLPKMLFRAHPNSLCISAARVFRLINFLLSPLVLLVEDVSRVIL